jgi:16S rRNA (uracil1498-N3)-methyltransferase
MHLFYSPDIKSNQYTLPEEESKHCIKVLRLKKGDIIHLTDGLGNLFETVITEDHPKRCLLEVLNMDKDYGKRNFKIHMAVAPTKNINRYEWFLEKATEIGVDEITPLICEHSERRIIKPDRLKKVITAAMKQSLKAYHPVLNETIDFRKLIEQYKSGYIAYCSDGFRDHLKTVYQKGEDTLILIGPEGDFSKKEVGMAMEAGFKPVSLGNSRLRTETAALAACHIVNLRNE